jgi:hypothetical protein
MMTAIVFDIVAKSGGGAAAVGVAVATNAGQFTGGAGKTFGGTFHGCCVACCDAWVAR